MNSYNCYFVTQNPNDLDKIFMFIVKHNSFGISLFKDHNNNFQNLIGNNPNTASFQLNSTLSLFDSTNKIKSFIDLNNIGMYLFLLLSNDEHIYFSNPVKTELVKQKSNKKRPLPHYLNVVK